MYTCAKPHATTRKPSLLTPNRNLHLTFRAQCLLGHALRHCGPKVSTPSAIACESVFIIAWYFASPLLATAPLTLLQTSSDLIHPSTNTFARVFKRLPSCTSLTSLGCVSHSHPTRWLPSASANTSRTNWHPVGSCPRHLAVGQSSRPVFTQTPLVQGSLKNVLDSHKLHVFSRSLFDPTLPSFSSLLLSSSKPCNTPCVDTTCCLR